MAQDKNIIEHNSKIESELFALVKSIINLNEKYQKGIVNDNFFRKALKNAMNNLLKLHMILKEKNIQMMSLLQKMNLSQEYNSVIKIINHMTTLNIPDNPTKIKNRTFLELPGITSEITSSFITLMDALSLDGLRKKDLVIRLFEELNQSLNNFPGLDDILSESKSIQKKIQTQFDILNLKPSLKNEILDDLYLLFKEFQNRLNLKS